MAEVDAAVKLLLKGCGSVLSVLDAAAECCWLSGRGSMLSVEDDAAVECCRLNGRGSALSVEDAAAEVLLIGCGLMLSVEVDATARTLKDCRPKVTRSGLNSLPLCIACCIPLLFRLPLCTVFSVEKTVPPSPVRGGLPM